MPWEGDWPGGRIWVDDRGRKTYHVRKMVAGKRYEVSTRCSSLRAAIVWLEAFEKDPNALHNRTVDQPLLLTDDLIDAFATWSEKTKRNTRKHVRDQRRALEWWKERLRGDLRKQTLRDNVAPHLDGIKGRQKLIATIKAFYAWLRKQRHLLTHAEDPTIDLAVPQAKPAQWGRSKVISQHDENRLVGALGGVWSDAVRLLSATGMHLSELEVFARDGQVDGETLTLPHTKGGGAHHIAVSKETAAVARRVVGSNLSTSTLHHKWRAACDLLGIVADIGPGMFRHTFATRMVEAGATPEAVAAYLHHRSAQTTMRFYAALGVVPMPKVG